MEPRHPLRVTAVPAPGSVRVLGLAGEMDYDSRDQLRRALAAALEEDPSLLVLDLSGLDFCDSSALDELFRARHDKPGVPIVLAAPRPQVRRLFDLTGIGQVFVIAESVAAAIEHHGLTGTGQG
ncbi:STAS domain-containing protein [Kitasatospora sp. NPDC090308]|uniref:STAS domain-containing protein n=1 Tax=Kitasatospora sp. NPDC090308 TaxID=3364082 RepID=UPI00382A55B5